MSPSPSTRDYYHLACYYLLRIFMDWKNVLVHERNNEYDRISNLPDNIICHILSFMPTIFSVRTRILSKRWKQLFTLVPVLDFSFCPENHDPDSTSRFLNFVTWVFSSYNVNKMDRFCYKKVDCVQNPSPLLHFWISESIQRGVKELDVREFMGTSLALPSCVFTCKTLTCLKLNCGFHLKVPVDVCLPCVKTLHLLGVSFADACSVTRLFKSCPVLEDLSFHFLHSDYEQTLNISVPTLKRLKIEQYSNYFHIVLDVPCLECFEYIGYYENCVISAAHDFKLLDKACFDFQMYCHRVDKVVNMVGHVRHLCFSAFTLKAFEENKSLSPPIFNKVTHLDISGISSSHQQLVVDLLNGTPRLEVLVINCDLNSTEDDDQLLPNYVPTCVSLHLKEVEVFGFSVLKYQCKLMEYF